MYVQDHVVTRLRQGSTLVFSLLHPKMSNVCFFMNVDLCPHKKFLGCLPVSLKTFCVLS